MLPQIIFFALMLMSLGMDLANHGKEVTKKENFWTSLLAMVIVNGILYWGGWFNALLGK